MGIFKNQIRTLIISIDEDDMLSPTTKNICNDIFTIFTNLSQLILRESSYKNHVRLFLADGLLLSTFRSSTLLELRVRIQCFDDCLYLLDGRFSQLHTLYVDFTHIRHPEEIENKVSCTRKISVVK